MSETGFIYTLPVQVRLAAPLKNAEQGRLLAVKMEQVVTDGFEFSEEATISEVICLHPREGRLRFMTTDQQLTEG